LLSFYDGRTPTGNFNLKFTSRGAMLNGKLCKRRRSTASDSAVIGSARSGTVAT
jgi:hypothetical protein